MAKEMNLKPFIAIGAGDIIKRNLESLGWTQEDLAQITDIPNKTISLLINNKQRISIEIAKELSNAFETSPEYWLNLDNNFHRNKLKKNLDRTGNRRIPDPRHPAICWYR